MTLAEKQANEIICSGVNQPSYTNENEPFMSKCAEVVRYLSSDY